MDEVEVEVVGGRVVVGAVVSSTVVGSIVEDRDVGVGRGGVRIGSAGCGGERDHGDANHTDHPDSPAMGSILAGPHPGTAAPDCEARSVGIASSLMAERPTITIPDSEPPADLLIEDETIGDGEEAVVGKRVYVHYAGAAWSTGDEFDASWNRGDVFDFRLGGGEVIEGWDKGVAGMRVGGRRRLTIPPHLGYGSRGAGGVIKGGETLVFVVDLVNVR